MTAAWDKLRKPMDVRRGCVGKARYPSRSYAQGAMRALRVAYPGAYPSTVRPYRCPASTGKGKGHWHLGAEW